MWPFNNKPKDNDMIVAEAYDKKGILLIKTYLHPGDRAVHFATPLCDYSLVIYKTNPEVGLK